MISIISSIKLPQGLGVASVGTTFTMHIYNWMNMGNINSIVLLIISLLTIIVMYFKARNYILDKKIKERQLQRMIDEDNEIEIENGE